MTATDDFPGPISTFRELGEFELRQLERRFAAVEPPSPRTGRRDLDGLLGWLHPGSLVLVTGPPGSGKTAFLTTLAVSLAQAGWRTVFLSRDLPLAELSTRFTALVSSVPLKRLRDGVLAARHWLAVGAAFADDLPLHVIDGHGDGHDEASLIGAVAGFSPTVLLDDGLTAADLYRIPSQWARAVPHAVRVVSPTSCHEGVMPGPASVNADVHLALRRTSPTDRGPVTAVEVEVVRNRFGACGSVSLVLRRDLLRFADVTDRRPD